jgi:hypothetical protein
MAELVDTLKLLMVETDMFEITGGNNDNQLPSDFNFSAFLYQVPLNTGTLFLISKGTINFDDTGTGI